MNFPSKTLIVGIAVSGLLSACATTTPPQLVEARDAYSASSTGLAGKLTPTELYDAKKVLDKANQEFDEHGDTSEVRDYAYIAKRKIELAETKARTQVDRQRIADAVKQGVVVRDSQFKNLEAGLAKTREQLEAEQPRSPERQRPRADHCTARV